MAAGHVLAIDVWQWELPELSSTKSSRSHRGDLPVPNPPRARRLDQHACLHVT